jgi:hypothetical protein
MIKLSAADDGAAKDAVLAALAPYGGDLLTSCWLPEYDGCVAALQAHGRMLAPGADICVTSLKRLYAASFDAGVDPIKLAHALAKLPGVEYVEPRLVRRTLAIPDDPQYGNLGQDHFAFHNFPAGWNLVSLPIVPRNDRREVVDANAVWRWDSMVQRYVEEEFVNAEASYWIHTDIAGAAALSGVAANGLVKLPGGWHLLGPAVERAHGLAAHAWYWDAAAQRLRRQNPDQSLLPGSAYWVWSPVSAFVDLGAE